MSGMNYKEIDKNLHRPHRDPDSLDDLMYPHTNDLLYAHGDDLPYNLDLEHLDLGDDAAGAGVERWDDMNLNNCTVCRHAGGGITCCLEHGDVCDRNSNNSPTRGKLRVRSPKGQGSNPLIPKRWRRLVEEADASANATENYLGDRRATLNNRRSTKCNINTKPTYHMDPSPDEMFNSCMGRRLVIHVMRDALKNYVYTPTSASVKAMLLSELIVDTARTYLSPRYPRYKWVCHVTIVQNRGQSMLVGGKVLCNTKYDKCASYTYYSKKHEGNYVCCAVLFGLYKE